MNINSASLFLIASLVTASWLPAFGQTTQNSITVNTDKPSYSDGDQMTISGKVSTQLNVPISIVIKDPSQNVVMIGQVAPNADNTYSTLVTAGGRLWTATGMYEVDVTYGSKDTTAKTTFDFTGKMSGTSGNGTGMPGNQTIPEFGSMAFIVFIISMMALVFYVKLRTKFRIP